MPSKEQVRSKLISKLRELFQLNQPDLDFGFYRIMHAKAEQTKDFIENDLLKIIKDALGSIDDEKKEALYQQYKESVLTAKEYGAPDPENTPAAKEAREKYEALNESADAEIEIYNHLYRFFERYYDDGDFISRRYYTRETPGKAAPFAVPYQGEEVKLHWANADQYYIKTAEFFNNFTFDPGQASEIRKMSKEERYLNEIPEDPNMVHFRLVDVTEGEHDNVKVSEKDKRYFIIHKDQPVDMNENGELICNFEYRSDPEKKGQENSWRDKRNSESVSTILTHLQTLAQTDPKLAPKVNEYKNLLSTPAPTESDKNRSLLAKYIHQYTARNTMDYFIHKDLGAFLRRELDFYIKNEIMCLDDIENAEAPAVESYLSKIKVLRKIAGKLIAFLAQLEDFQKKLWLKKKFIVETNYCITLDRIPEDLYPEIASNEEQCEEWIKLFSIDEIQGDLHSPSFSQPLTVEFLKANDKLVLDTRFFDESFKARFLDSIDNLDEQCDGLLIHSENFQALNLLQERYREQVKCVYIDPPYNTGNDGFIYRDSYQHSSWLSMLENRVILAWHLIDESGSSFSSIDDNEQANLKALFEMIHGDKNFLGYFVWLARAGKDHTAKYASVSQEYVLSFAKNKSTTQLGKDERVREDGNYEDEKGRYKREQLRQWGTNDRREDRPTMYYPVEAPNGRKIYPVRADGTEGCWRVQKARMIQMIKDGDVEFVEDGNSWVLYAKKRDGQVTRTAFSTLIDNAGSAATGTLEIKALFNEKVFSTTKPKALLEHILEFSDTKNSTILDYFAGSGTTGHAVINLNREDGGDRKYILVEMGDYFDTVLKPRIAKVVYSDKWKDGKPTDRNTGVSHCFKYMRLESYEDTLNNLCLEDNPHRKSALERNPSLKEDFILHYMLDVETRGSKSLLNIDAFADPTAYMMKVKKPGSDMSTNRTVDLIETFHYLIGLRVVHISYPQTYQATFKRLLDPELPEDQNTKLVVDGSIQENAQGAWWFRAIEGWVPKDPMDPNNGLREKVLIVWRNLTGNIEQDNAMLDEWFQKNRIRSRNFEFDTIYVNGSNNLPNLKKEDENWKVCLIEEEFMKRMWDGVGI